MQIRKSEWLAVIILLSQAAGAYAQTFEPLELAREIFSKDSHIDAAAYISGEYTGPTGKDLDGDLRTKFFLLEQKERAAAVAMTICDGAGNGRDYYLYFKKETVWKMYALRSLAMTGMIESLKTHLEQMTSEEIERTIMKTGNEYAMFSSMEEYGFLLGNSRLILEFDDNIIQHFLKNRNEFERIKDLALRELNDTYKHRNRELSVALVENLKSEYQKIYISSVSSGDVELGDCLNFLIGGILDNTVGYLYTDTKMGFPGISPERVIMIREIGNGWYIYKRT
jgi:hypothetical protein